MVIRKQGLTVVCQRSLRHGSGAKNYGFEQFYPEKGLTTEEYADRVEKWMRLMKEVTRK